MKEMPDVYIMNLPTMTKRRYISIGAMLANDVPLEKIHIHRGIDDRKFANSNELIEAAITDGFPQFESYLNQDKAIARFGQLWNYCRFWRNVVERDKTELLIQDDRRLRYKYPKIIENIEDIIYSDNFHFLSLWGYKGILRAEIKPHPSNKYISEGVIGSGACVCHIVSPQGAQWILENVVGYIPSFKHVSVEWVLLGKCQNQPGFYTLVNALFGASNMVPDGQKNKQFLPGRIWRGGKLIRPV